MTDDACGRPPARGRLLVERIASRACASRLILGGQATSLLRARIGAGLNAARLASGLSSHEAAVALGVNNLAIELWERGDTPVQAHTLLLLCELYGANPAQVLDMAWRAL